MALRLQFWMHLIHVVAEGCVAAAYLLIQNWKWLLATTGETGSAAGKQRKRRWAKFRDEIIFPSLILKFLHSVKQK